MTDDNQANSQQEARAVGKQIWSAYSIYLDLCNAFPKLEADFEAKWNIWKSAISALPSREDWSSAPGFDDLVALGPKIIPFLVNKLGLHPDDTSPVVLYIKLEPDSEFLRGFDPQTQLDLILKENFNRNRIIRDGFANWTEHSKRFSRESHSTFYTMCDEFFELVALGPSIIPHIMIKYAKKKKVMCWYDLIHKIVWGHMSGITANGMEIMYTKWSDWFENKNYDEAPHFGSHAFQRQDLSCLHDCCIHDEFRKS